MEVAYTIEQRWSEVGRTVRFVPYRPLGQRADVVTLRREWLFHC